MNVIEVVGHIIGWILLIPILIIVSIFLLLLAMGMGILCFFIWSFQLARKDLTKVWNLYKNRKRCIDDVID